MPENFVVVLGAGAPSLAAAVLLAEGGTPVRQVTRRGAGAAHPLVERIAADATDTARLAEIATGATALISGAVPPYHRWAAELPALAASVLAAVEKAGVPYVMLGNTYAYGAVSPMTEDQPFAPDTVKGEVRARIWLDAVAAHEAGRVRVTEVRAGAFLGPGAGSLYRLSVLPDLLAGRPVSWPGDLDAPRTWADVRDVGATLVAAARSDVAWGRAWHVPGPTLSVRELTRRLAVSAGVPEPPLSRIGADDVTAMAASDPEFGPVLREVLEMLPGMDGPEIIESARTERELGVRHRPLDEILTGTLAS